MVTCTFSRPRAHVLLSACIKVKVKVSSNTVFYISILLSFPRSTTKTSIRFCFDPHRSASARMTTTLVDKDIQSVEDDHTNEQTAQDTDVAEVRYPGKLKFTLLVIAYVLRP